MVHGLNTSIPVKNIISIQAYTRYTVRVMKAGHF